jgi:hypothetical protein
MESHNWKKDYRQENIEDLHLDLENPRTDTGVSLTYDEIIRELLEENIIDLAESISTKGYAAVSVLMTVREKDKNIVIDGNRRLLALKSLHNPNFIKKFVDPNDFEKIKRFSNEKKEDVSSVTVIFYPKRMYAEQEMSILHLDGESVQKWKPLRQYRYFQRRLGSSSIEELSETLGIKSERIRTGIKTIQLYELAKNSINFGEELNRQIFDDKNFKTDKFQKTVVNEEGERFLGYSFSETENKILIVEKKHFFERLKVVILELYNSQSLYFASAQYPTKNRASFFKTVEPSFVDGKEYKKELKKEEEADTAGQNKLFPLPATPQEDKEHVPQERSNKKPIGLFFTSDIPYKLTNSSLRIMYDELKDIQVERFPNATHDLLRSFLECSLVEFLTQKKEYEKIQNNKQHTPKLGELLTHVIGNNVIDDSHVIANLNEIKADWDKPYSLHRMNKVNHNKNYASAESDVRVAWSKLEDLFRIILNSKSSK